MYIVNIKCALILLCPSSKVISQAAIWNKDEEKFYISVVDVVGIISESSDGRKYWNKLKQRLKEEGNDGYKL